MCKRFKLLQSPHKQYLYIPELYSLNVLKEYDSEADIISLINSHIKKRGRLKSDKLAESINPSSFHLKDVVLNVSHRCNLNCVYCYAKKINSSNSIMSSNIAESVINRTLSLSKNGLSSVKFLGGEPTFAWNIIKKLVNGYKMKSEVLGYTTPQFVMVTNGTNISRKMAIFLAANKIFVWVSLDGYKTIHNALRPQKSGKGSYRNAINGIQNLLSNGVKIGIEAVYTNLHYKRGITPQMMIDHFLNLGIRDIQISPAVGDWHGYHSSDIIERVGVYFNEAAKKCIKSHCTLDPYSLRGIDFIIRNYVGELRHQYFCGAGLTFMAINFDGEAFPCYLVESAKTSYGTIGPEWSNKRYHGVRKMFIKNSKRNHRECLNCWAFEICESCLGTSFQLSKTITKPPDWFCKFQRDIIEAVLLEISETSTTEDWPLLVSNLSARYKNGSSK